MADELGDGLIEIVRQQEHRVFVLQVGNGQPVEYAVVVTTRDPLVRNTRCLIHESDALQVNAVPGKCRVLGHQVKELLRASP